ncbi:hypothetical protein KY285_000335 [Solanum tuberosum]|nr:hypothetical protein KY284_000375 [Solanum tuberosum]KAH0764464.1 hypothetical protein KY285_000335 [Solanum tuberosum]
METSNSNGKLRQHNRERVVVTVDNSTYLVANEGVLKIDVGATGAVKLNDILDNVKNISADVVLMGEKKGSLFVMVVGEAYVKKTSQQIAQQFGMLGWGTWDTNC